MGNSVNIVKQYSQEKGRLESQINVIAELSKRRLEEVIALDNLQQLIPQRIWLTEVKLENHKMNMHGFAISENDISEFIKNLDDSVFFTNVNLSGTVESRSDQGVLQKFEITCDVESI